MAYMKRARPGGLAASVVAGPRTPTRTIVARVATRTALRRPDSTRNVSPSYRDDAVSAPSDGRAAAVTVATGLGACGRDVIRRRDGDLVSRHVPRDAGGRSGYGRLSSETTANSYWG